VGAATALKLAADNRDSNVEHCRGLRDRLQQEMLTGIADTRLNGHPEKRLPGHLNVSFSYIEGESILLNLDLQGIAVASGSACTSGDEAPSHVLTAIGIPPVTARGSVRFSVGPQNTDDEVDYVMSVLPGIVDRLREMSPLAGTAEPDS
jgi:cysteine desulfurase